MGSLVNGIPPFSGGVAASQCEEEPAPMWRIAKQQAEDGVFNPILPGRVLTTFSLRTINTHTRTHASTHARTHTHTHSTVFTSFIFQFWWWWVARVWLIQLSFFLSGRSRSYRQSTACTHLSMWKMEFYNKHGWQRHEYPEGNQYPTTLTTHSYLQL